MAVTKAEYPCMDVVLLQIESEGDNPLFVQRSTSEEGLMYETPIKLDKAVPLLAFFRDVLGFKLGRDIDFSYSIFRQSLQSKIGHICYKTLPVFTTYRTSVYFCGIHPFVVFHIRCK